MELDTLSSVSNYSTQTKNANQTRVETGASNVSVEKILPEVSGKKSAIVNKTGASVYFKAEKDVLQKADHKLNEKGYTGAGTVHYMGSDSEENESKSDRNINESLDKAIAEINEKLVGGNNECQYNVHKQTGIIQIKVLNTKTKEVVREIPAVNRLDALAKMWELAGILIDTKG